MFDKIIDYFKRRTDVLYDFNQKFDEYVEKSQSHIKSLEEEIEQLRAEKAVWQGVQMGTVDIVKELEQEVKRLNALLEGRDKFIVENGLFDSFLETLPNVREKKQ